MTELPSEARLTDTNQSSDRSLLLRLKQGNADAATELYLRYADRLHALARSQSSPELARQIDSEEIVQSVFRSFFCGAQKGLYDVPVGEELWKLFLIIALNKIRAKGAYHLAAKRDSRRTSGSYVLEYHVNAVESDDAVSLKILEMSIEDSLKTMPVHYQEMVKLRVEGYDIEEIARRSKRSKRTVERVLQEVRQKLSHLLMVED